MPAAKDKKLTPNRYYVYVVAINERVAYIGKGTGERLKSHLRSSHNTELREMVKTARTRGDRVRAKKIMSNLPEHAALRLERTLICRYDSRLVNASLGSLAPHEKAAIQCRGELSRMMPREMYLRKKCRWGYSLEYRARMYDQIKAEYEKVLGLTETNPEWFVPKSRMVIEVNASS